MRTKANLNLSKKTPKNFNKYLTAVQYCAIINYRKEVKKLGLINLVTSIIALVTAVITLITTLKKHHSDNE